MFPVTIDKSGHNSLGFLVVVCNSRLKQLKRKELLFFNCFKGGLDSEIEDHGIYVKSITPNGAADKSKLLLEGKNIHILIA